MTVNELIEQLQELVEENEANGEREIRIATQKTYPLQFELDGIAHGNPDLDDALHALKTHLAEKADGNPHYADDDDMETIVDDIADGFGIDAEDLQDAYDKRNEPKQPEPVFLCTGDHPRNGSPYCSKQLWSQF